MQQNKTTTSRHHHDLSTQLSWAILGALAFILMQFEFPLFPALPYLKMDLSDVIVTMSTFILGPSAAVFIGLIKAMLNFFIKGANLINLVGDIAAFAASVTFALPIYYILKDKAAKPKYYAKKILAFVVATLSLTVILSILNYFLITPVYITLAGFKLNTSLLNYVLYTIIPFNLIKGVVLSIVSYGFFVSVLPTLMKFNKRHSDRTGK